MTWLLCACLSPGASPNPGHSSPLEGTGLHNGSHGCWSSYLALQPKVRGKGRGAKSSQASAAKGQTVGRDANGSGVADEGPVEGEAIEAGGVTGCDPAWARKVEEFLVSDFSGRKRPTP